jgi:hypothetical protein
MGMGQGQWTKGKAAVANGRMAIAPTADRWSGDR